MDLKPPEEKPTSDQEAVAEECLLFDEILNSDREVTDEEADRFLTHVHHCAHHKAMAQEDKDFFDNFVNEYRKRMKEKGIIMPSASRQSKECPRRVDIIKFKRDLKTPGLKTITDETHAKIMHHVLNRCARCTDFIERLDASITEGEAFINSIPEDQLIQLAQTTPDDDWRTLSAIVEKCADVLKQGPNLQAISALNILFKRGQISDLLKARIDDILNPIG